MAMVFFLCVKYLRFYFLHVKCAVLNCRQFDIIAKAEHRLRPEYEDRKKWLAWWVDFIWFFVVRRKAVECAIEMPLSQMDLIINVYLWIFAPLGRCHTCTKQITCGYEIKFHI